MTRTVAILLSVCCGLTPAVGQTMELAMPSNATMAQENRRAPGETFVPISPIVDGQVELRTAEGYATQQAWQVKNSDQTTLQLLAPLRDQLINDGFQILLECDTNLCGGFDFRYQVDLLPEPEMHVDLGDFRSLTAERKIDDEAFDIINIFVSKSARTGFIHITQIAPKADETNTIITSTKSSNKADLGDAEQDPADVAAQLETTGRAALDDLVFATGSSQLGEAEFQSLGQLAQYLTDNPTTTVALVGHTDALGALDSNMSLSQRRANSVLQRLVSEYAVPRRQLEAAGVGYLAPRAKNDTDTGRELNRRVEVVITSIAQE